MPAPGILFAVFCFLFTLGVMVALLNEALNPRTESSVKMTLYICSICCLSSAVYLGEVIWNY